MRCPQRAQEGLAKHRRLSKKSDFQRAFQRGRRFHSRCLVVVLHENRLGFSRLGISIRKKIGKAVLRNRLKRYIREAFRRDSTIRDRSLDVVVIVRSGYSVHFAFLKNDFKKAFGGG